MAVQIANPVVVGKVERLAKATGPSKTAVVERALDRLWAKRWSRPMATSVWRHCWRNWIGFRTGPMPLIRWTGTSRACPNDHGGHVGAGGHCVFRAGALTLFASHQDGRKGLGQHGVGRRDPHGRPWSAGSTSGDPGGRFAAAAAADDRASCAGADRGGCCLLGVCGLR